MKMATVSSKELGTNCWSPKRFCGGRCDRIMYCKYPEKETCKAVATEVEFIKQDKVKRIEQISETVQKALEQLEQRASRDLEKLNGLNERVSLQ